GKFGVRSMDDGAVVVDRLGGACRQNLRKFGRRHAILPPAQAAAHPTRVTPESILEYPQATPPAGGETLEIAPGVHWARMPLPFALDHINLWLLEDESD